MLSLETTREAVKLVEERFFVIVVIAGDRSLVG